MTFEELRALLQGQPIYSTQRKQWGRVRYLMKSHALEFEETPTDVTILYVGSDTCDLYRREGDPYP